MAALMLHLFPGLPANLALPKKTFAGWFANKFVFEKKNLGLIKMTAEAANIGNGDIVLDIGHGPGVGMLLAMEKGAARVIGVELSEYMADKAKVKLKDHLEKVEFIRGDICETSLSIPSASVDKCMSVNCIYFWNDLDAGSKELYRIMKPGGLVVFGTRLQSLNAAKHIRRDLFRNVDFDIIRTALESAGFTDITYNKPDPENIRAGAIFVDETITARR